MSVSDWERIERYKQAFIDGDAIADIWMVSDITDVEEDLTREEARNVLASLRDEVDAGLGINWDTIEATIPFHREERY
jgi:hypothetical protein